MAEFDSLSTVRHVGLVPPAPAPPAPPPPICLRSVSEGAEKSKGQEVHRPLECFSADEQGRRAYQNLLSQGLLPKDDKHFVLTCYSPIKPVLQNGPVCGLVALSMASQLSNKSHVSADDIFYEAQKRGYSKQGEMFSVQYFKELASQFVSSPTEIMHLNRQEQSEQAILASIVKNLLQKYVLLIPYDADKNHSPCQKKGHKAHWALIAGVVIVLSDSDDFPTSVKSACRRDAEVSALFHWPDDPDSSVCEDLASSIEALQCHQESNRPGGRINLYVYGHQGKSKHAGVWSLEELLQSNAQLEEAGPERDVEGYVFPPEGIAAGLKSQMLIVTRTTKT